MTSAPWAMASSTIWSMRFTLALSMIGPISLTGSAPGRETAGDDVDHAGRELVGLSKDLGEEGVGLRGLTRQARDRGRPGGQRRGKRSDRQRDGRVPRSDDAGHSGRLAKHQTELAVGDLAGAAGLGQCEGGVET